MPTAFVHGNPETPAIWRPLISHLQRRDVVALHLPGFGAGSDPADAATKEEYVAWLIDQLEDLDDPVDVVGHDWGAPLVMRAACERPDLFRSWVSDGAGLIHPDYVWHDLAQVWQTPGAGEEAINGMTGLPIADRVGLFESLGFPADIAAEVAAAVDTEMGRCILALYRSAIQPAMVAWGRDAGAASARPGMTLINSADPYVGSGDLGREMGHRMGARVVEMEGFGHWWMLQDPAHGAAILEEFWASV